MIKFKTPEEIKVMREGGVILARIMNKLEKMVKPGITTKELDKAAESLILKYGARPNFKGYEGFPASICTSVNEEIVHCAPSDRVLKEGDILSLDAGLIYHDWNTDMAITIPVGNISPEAQRLIKVTKRALNLAIGKIKIGRTFGDIGYIIEKYVKDQGFFIIPEFCGHGIGRELHEDPQICNYGRRGEGERIRPGMVFCLEPIISAGNWEIKKNKNGYGYKTKDNSLSAHFEHMVAVTEKDIQILTKI